VLCVRACRSQLIAELVPEPAMQVKSVTWSLPSHDPAGRLAGHRHPHTIRSNGACREVSLLTGVTAATVLRAPSVDEVS
jgi:hypothetical protein